MTGRGIEMQGQGLLVRKGQNQIKLVEINAKGGVLTAHELFKCIGSSVISCTRVYIDYVEAHKGLESHSDMLAPFIEARMNGFSILETDFHSGKWIAEVSRLLNMPRIERQGKYGAVVIARFVRSL